MNDHVAEKQTLGNSDDACVTPRDMSALCHAGGNPAVVLSCKECGGEVDLNYIGKVREKLETNQICYVCNFWLEIIEAKNELYRVFIDGKAYVIGEFYHRLSPFCGFNGNKYRIKINNKAIITTKNLWFNGYIPDRFRSRLPNNAEFI
jgi:hypothetical protein